MMAKVIALNIIVFLLNMNPGSDDYYLYHSLWHLMSAAKCFYVASKVTDATL